MLSFNGHNLESIGTCGEPEFKFAEFSPNLETLKSANGSKLIGMRLDNAAVTFKIAIFGDAETRRESLSTLASWLNVTEPKKLVLPDTPDWYYMAVPNSGAAINANIDPYMFELEFALIDPIAYGEEKTATVPSGSSATITVGGTAPTKPRITASSAVRNSTSLVWGLKLDDGDFVHIPTGSNSSRSVVIDCDKRVSTVSSSAKLITLDSDWLELTPGSHTLAMDNGTGAATVKWRERWL